MLISDLIHSCSNESVAQAALLCIGEGFAERVREVARRKGMNVGRFVALVVRDFARRADDGVREALREKISGADQPLLNGLRVVLEPALEDGVIFIDDEAAMGRHFPIDVSCAGIHQYQ